MLAQVLKRMLAPGVDVGAGSDDDVGAGPGADLQLFTSPFHQCRPSENTIGCLIRVGCYNMLYRCLKLVNPLTPKIILRRLSVGHRVVPIGVKYIIIATVYSHQSHAV